MNDEQKTMKTWLGDRWSRWAVFLIGAGNILGWIAVWRFSLRGADVSPLHYTIYFGINLTGRWSTLFVLPAVGTVALIVHLVISRMVPHPMWRRLWLVLAAIITIMMLMDVAAIIFLLRNGA